MASSGRLTRDVLSPGLSFLVLVPLQPEELAEGVSDPSSLRTQTHHAAAGSELAGHGVTKDIPSSKSQFLAPRINRLVAALFIAARTCLVHKVISPAPFPVSSLTILLCIDNID